MTLSNVVCRSPTRQAPDELVVAEVQAHTVERPDDAFALHRRKLDGYAIETDDCGHR